MRRPRAFPRERGAGPGMREAREEPTAMPGSDDIAVHSYLLVTTRDITQTHNRHPGSIQ